MVDLVYFVRQSAGFLFDMNFDKSGHVRRGSLLSVSKVTRDVG
jgi:hypothetical protein